MGQDPAPRLRSLIQSDVTAGGAQGGSRSIILQAKVPACAAQVSTGRNRRDTNRQSAAEADTISQIIAGESRSCACASSAIPEVNDTITGKCSRKIGNEIWPSQSDTGAEKKRLSLSLA